MPHNFTTATKGAWLVESPDTLIPIAIEDCVFVDADKKEKKSLFLSADHPILKTLFDDGNPDAAHLRKKLNDPIIQQQLLQLFKENFLVVANINDKVLGIGEDGKGKNMLGRMLMQAHEQLIAHKKTGNSLASQADFIFQYTDDYDTFLTAAKNNTLENFKRELGHTEGYRFYDTQTDAAQKKKFLEDVLKGGVFSAHQNFIDLHQGTTFQNTHTLGFSTKSGAPTGVTVNGNITEFSLTHKKGRGSAAIETVYEFNREYDDKNNTASHTIKINPQSKTPFRLSFDEMTDAYHVLAVTDYEMRRKVQATLATKLKDKIHFNEEQHLLETNINTTMLSVEDDYTVPTIKTLLLPGRDPSALDLKDANGKEIVITAKQAAALTAYLNVFNTVHFKLNDTQTLTLTTAKKMTAQVSVGNATPGNPPDDDVALLPTL